MVNHIMKNTSRSTEQEINKVIVHHDAMLKEIQEKRNNASQFDTSAAEKILKSRGYDLPSSKETLAPLNKRRVVGRASLERDPRRCR